MYGVTDHRLRSIQLDLGRSQFALRKCSHSLDRSQFALRKCSHSFRSISVRIRAFTFRIISVRVNCVYDLFELFEASKYSKNELAISDSTSNLFFKYSFSSSI